MELAGLIISIFAVLFTLITYLIHDSKIKKQERLLNEYQLDKIKEEKNQTLKALIEANLIKGEKGNRTLKVYNKGKSIAKNVEVIIPESEGMKVFANPCPIDIRPQNGIEIFFVVYLSGYPNKIEITFKWKDDFKNDNVDKQVIPL